MTFQDPHMSSVAVDSDVNRQDWTFPGSRSDCSGIITHAICHLSDGDIEADACKAFTTSCYQSSYQIRENTASLPGL